MNDENIGKEIRHSAPSEDIRPPIGEVHIEQISNHIEKHIGKIDFVYHELVSDLVHIDVHIVRPSEERPWTTLITSGMSDLPMTPPQGRESLNFSELIIDLPPDWDLSQDGLRNGNNYWPIRNLKFLARFPHLYKTWLSFGHTIPNGGDHPEPYSKNTEMCCMMVTFPYSVKQDFFKLTVKDGVTIHFWSLRPIYREEMEFKRKNGAEKLEELFEENEIGPILDPGRLNVCKRKKWLGLF